jgi:hypothetical protein
MCRTKWYLVGSIDIDNKTRKVNQTLILLTGLFRDNDLKTILLFCGYAYTCLCTFPSRCVVAGGVLTTCLPSWLDGWTGTDSASDQCFHRLGPIAVRTLYSNSHSPLHLGTIGVAHSQIHSSFILFASLYSTTVLPISPFLEGGAWSRQAFYPSAQPLASSNKLRPR